MPEEPSALWNLCFNVPIPVALPHMSDHLMAQVYHFALECPVRQGQHLGGTHKQVTEHQSFAEPSPSVSAYGEIKI